MTTGIVSAVGRQPHPHETVTPELGIFGKTVKSRLAVRNGLRSNRGIYVFATTTGNEESGTGLTTGDVIASVNGKPIISMQELRTAIHELNGSKPAIVQIEPQGQYVYIEREFEERPPASSTDQVGKHEAEPGPHRHNSSRKRLSRRCSAGDVARA